MPPAVELAGLDTVEYSLDVYLPEVQRRHEGLVEPDGTVVDAEPVTLAEALELTGGTR